MVKCTMHDKIYADLRYLIIKDCGKLKFKTVLLFVCKQVDQRTFKNLNMKMKLLKYLFIN